MIRQYPFHELWSDGYVHNVYHIQPIKHSVNYWFFFIFFFKSKKIKQHEEVAIAFLASVQLLWTFVETSEFNWKTHSYSGPTVQLRINFASFSFESFYVLFPES